MKNVIKLYKCQLGIFLTHGKDYFEVRSTDWDGYINKVGLYESIQDDLQ